MQYSYGKTITTAGITGQFFNALHNPSTSTGVTAVVTPFRNLTNEAITIAINAGDTLELKVKQVKPSGNIIGFS
jgi:hypothetical protein